ncbi:hypothetical protein MRB53_036949 [Persea americana]|nr:hypothetical protein MRB53_036949 [Persea americana]
MTPSSGRIAPWLRAWQACPTCQLPECLNTAMPQRALDWQRQATITTLDLGLMGQSSTLPMHCLDRIAKYLRLSLCLNVSHHSGFPASVHIEEESPRGSPNHSGIALLHPTVPAALRIQPTRIQPRFWQEAFIYSPADQFAAHDRSITTSGAPGAFGGHLRSVFLLDRSSSISFNPRPPCTSPCSYGQHCSSFEAVSIVDRADSVVEAETQTAVGICNNIHASQSASAASLASKTATATGAHTSTGAASGLLIGAKSPGFGVGLEMAALVVRCGSRRSFAVVNLSSLGIVKPDYMRRTPRYADFMSLYGRSNQSSDQQNAANNQCFVAAKGPMTYAFRHPSFSGLFVTCAQRPQTTLPPAVTKPSSLTFTSMIVPLVRTPSCVYNGLCGFFLTPSIGSWTVTPSSGCVTFAFLYLNPIGRMNLSYLTGLRVKSGPTKVGS